MAVVLDPDFLPAALSNRRYRARVRSSGRGVPLVLALEREGGRVSRFVSWIDREGDEAAIRYAERLVKFFLWSRGGWKVWVGGPRVVGEAIRRAYSAAGERAFDAGLMGRVYERPFEVVVARPEEVPPEKEQSAALGGHWNGCRIGFDLGASDFKVAAVREGGVLYVSEHRWSPRDEADPAYHFERLNEGIKMAAAHLPRVDGIGGSTAGIVVNNRIRVASIFRAVPGERFGEAASIFERLRGVWRVPVEVANDGDVTALSGAQSLKTGGVLGIAMGSSEAAGYVNAVGRMTGWLNELAFAPVDENPQADVDEWSGDRGVGGLQLSQQAVGRLLPAAGIELPIAMALPERLAEVQRLMERGDVRAAGIYRRIGQYLGWAAAHYSEFYSFGHLLVLGRVTSGAGGGVLLEEARRVLGTEFPELGVEFHLPDEADRRTGQAVAAASLPVVG